MENTLGRFRKYNVEKKSFTYIKKRLKDNNFVTQGSGLEDTCGEEIFEGDIVQIEGTPKRYVIEKYKECFIMVDIDTKDRSILEGDPLALRIVGNIFS